MTTEKKTKQENSAGIIYSSPAQCIQSVIAGSKFGIFGGDTLELLSNLPERSVDLIVTSPPYCIGKKYENTRSLSDFITFHEQVLPMVSKCLRPGGHLCWQVGYHASNGFIEPLDFQVHSIVRKIKGLSLRNRIIWTFGHGPHASKRFSGRHETLLWYTKGKPSTFYLDRVRVPQKYPGKRHYKGARKGEFSGHPLGKNPGDVWNFPSVKASHVEKTNHPCQFPVALVQRLVRALTNENDLVLDPFIGSGTTAVAALLEKRRVLGAEINEEYLKIIMKRISETIEGEIRYRPLNRPDYIPCKSDPIETPAHFNKKTGS